MVSLVHWSHLVTLVDQTNHYCLKWLKILVSTLYNKAIFIHFCQNDNFLMILSTSLRTSTVELSPFFIWQVGVTEPALQDRVKIIRWDDDGRVTVTTGFYHHHQQHQTKSLHHHTRQHQQRTISFLHHHQYYWWWCSHPVIEIILC